MKITDFGKLSKADFTQLRKAIEAALKPVSDQFNVDFTAGGATYLEGTATIKLKLQVRGAESMEALNFKQLAYIYDLLPEDLGKTFAADGKTFKIIGLNSRKQKNPIIIESEGKQYNADARWINGRLRPGSQRAVTLTETKRK